jgi:hypothetical protein
MAKRVRRVVAPLTGPLTKNDPSSEPTDFVSAARKAAQAAAMAANEHSQNNKAYAKLSVPSFSRSDGMTNSVYSLGTATVVSGCYGDELGFQWLRESWSKAFDEFECSDVDYTHDQTRWRRWDFSLSKALQGMIRSSGESLSDDITLKAREFG